MSTEHVTQVNLIEMAPWWWSELLIYIIPMALSSAANAEALSADVGKVRASLFVTEVIKINSKITPTF